MVRFNYINVNCNFFHNKLLPPMNRACRIAQNLFTEMFFHNSITQTTWIFSLEMAEIEDSQIPLFETYIFMF
jgi:hypothetical protein